MMKYRLTVCALTLSLLIPGVLSAASDPIAERQDLMKDTKNALGAMMNMVRGKADFDADTVMESLDVMLKVSEEAPALFPEGSETGGDTEALASVWDDREGFDKAMSAFNQASADAKAANPASVDELKPALNGILKTCKGCHDDYRVAKD